MKTARLILGDQLNIKHSWFDKTSDDVLFIIMEIRQETDYVTHHIQKLLTFFAAMRSFADSLRKKGHQVLYIKISDDRSSMSLAENLKKICRKKNIQKLEYQLPDEYRLDEQLRSLNDRLGIEIRAYDSEHFLTERFELRDFFRSKKSFIMENFYRMMRRKYDILLADDQPEGGRWNFDDQNRQKYSGEPALPEALCFKNDARKILQEIQNSNISYFGEVDPDALGWPVNRTQAKQLLDHFTEHLLPFFGTFQDAMTVASGTLFHSRLSFALNSKMLHPMEVIYRIIGEWKSRKKEISLSQTEGFIRQILGWREYMRGVYWAKMPEYKNLNFFNHRYKLPDFYWTGHTKMNCMKHAIGQSLESAYAHHIQRLMITGNFALLAGINPDEVDNWYLGIYIDAIEWVEITNTRGMSQFADGGIVGTKPYVSSANYINKMSDYCRHCYYLYSKKHGDKSCPFNSLYWDFYQRNRKLLEKNPRVAMINRTLDRMDHDMRDKILAQAQYYHENLEDL